MLLVMERTTVVFMKLAVTETIYHYHVSERRVII